MQLERKDAPLEVFDTSSDSRVSVNDRKLSFSLDFGTELEFNTQYYVVIEPGAVVGLQSCLGGGAPFPGISHSSDWYIMTVTGIESCSAERSTVCHSVRIRLPVCN